MKQRQTMKKNSPAEKSDNQKYILQLYVNGGKPSSERAIRNIKSICEGHFDNNYKLQVIDVKKHPETIIEKDIVATPTLIKQLPDPLRILIGDLSDMDHVMLGLNLKKL